MTAAETQRREFEGMDDLDIIYALSDHVGFVGEVIHVYNHYSDIGNEDLPWLNNEAASRIDKIKALVGTVEVRMKKNRHENRMGGVS